MENKEPQACKAPLEDIKRAALEHYEELATKCHHWNSFIPQAIKAYQEPAESPSSIEGEENQETIAQWCDGAFGVVHNINSVFARANKEMAELLMEAATGDNGQKKIEECADVVICLYRAVNLLGGDLNKAVAEKMAKNRERKWNKDGFGHGQHVPSPALPVKEEEKLPAYISAWVDEWAGVYAYENGDKKDFDTLKSQFEDACMMFYKMLLKTNQLQNGK